MNRIIPRRPVWRKGNEGFSGRHPLPRAITISIVDFKLFDCPEYHSFFQLLEVTRHTLLTDKMGLHFFELPKLPVDVDENNMLLLWLSLFKANTEEELTKIKAMEVPVMSQAIDAYYTITASSRFQEIERLRDKASHDEAQALYHAEQEGMSRRNAEVARNALKLNLPVDTIRQLTGLSEAEIEELEHS